MTRDLGILPLFRSAARTAAKSRTAVRGAVFVRDVCNKVIRYRFATSWHPAETGEDWLLSLVAPNARTFVDVGANVGEWTAAARALAPPDARFVVVDPGRSASENLRRRFADAGNVAVARVALSSTSGNATFHEGPNADQRSSLSPEIVSDLPGVLAHEVTVSTLDVLAREHAMPHVDFLKIDTEGFDLHVMQGATRLLTSRSIGIVQFEYNDPWRYAGSTLYAAYRLLEAAGYRAFVLRHDGLYDFDYPLYGDFFGYSNFVAASPEFLHVLTPHVRGTV